MKIKAAIFDMDGTLLDSMGMWRMALPNYFKSLNMEPNTNINTVVENMSFVQAATYLAEELHLNKTADEIYSEIEESIVYQYENTILLKPNVETYLRQLRKDGTSCCVATLSDKYMAETVLKRLGIYDCFDFILTVGEVGKSKEHPDIYLQCAEKMNTPKEECVVFEDAPYAIKTVKEAGFISYGVYDSWQKYPENFTEKYCDRFIIGYDELII